MTGNLLDKFEPKGFGSVSSPGSLEERVAMLAP